jgi:transposase-like protein
MLGLKEKKQRRKYDSFSKEKKRAIIEDYLQSDLSKQAIWKKHTGRDKEHGKISHWMRKYGYFSDYTEKSITFPL